MNLVEMENTHGSTRKVQKKINISVTIILVTFYFPLET